MMFVFKSSTTKINQFNERFMYVHVPILVAVATAAVGGGATAATAAAAAAAAAAAVTAATAATATTAVVTAASIDQIHMCGLKQNVF
jgi:hypothetical protein